MKSLRTVFVLAVTCCFIVASCSKKTGCPMNDTKRMNKPGKSKTGRLF